MGSHTSVSAFLFTLTASVWMAAGVTQTCPLLAGIPGRNGRDGLPGPPVPLGASNSSGLPGPPDPPGVSGAPCLPPQASCLFN